MLRIISRLWVIVTTVHSALRIPLTTGDTISPLWAVWVAAGKIFWNVIVDGSSRGCYLQTGARRGDTLQNIPLMRSRQCIKSQSLSFVHCIAVSFYTPLKWTCVCAHITKTLSLLSSAAPVSISLVVRYSNTRSKALTAFCQKRILPFSKPTDTVKREAHNFTSALLYKAGVFIRTRKCGLAWHPNSSTLCTRPIWFGKRNNWNNAHVVHWRHNWN